MVIPILMPMGGGFGGGYSGPSMPTGRLGLPIVPSGFTWEIRDNGQSNSILVPPLTVMLHGPGVDYIQTWQHANRRRGSIVRAAKRVLKLNNILVRFYGEDAK